MDLTLTSIQNVIHSQHFSAFVVTLLCVQMTPVSSIPVAAVHVEITQPPTYYTPRTPDAYLKSHNSEILFPEKFDKKCVPNLSLCNIKDDSDPMCGTDGVTYKNLDEFSCYRSQCLPGLSIRAVGACSSKSTKASSRVERLSKHGTLAVPQQDIGSSSVQKCIPDECGCSNEFTPLCGSDGITYGNECLMECNKKCSPTVTTFHSGYCGKIFFRDRLTNTFQDFGTAYRQVLFVQSSHTK